jgi:type I restriction enzyme, S subunit
VISELTQPQSGVEWLAALPQNWQLRPLLSLVDEINDKNIGGRVKNVLSLSYGRIVRRDTASNFGLLPESFDTYQIVQKGDIVLRLLDLQNDHESLRVGLVREEGIVTSAYVSIRPKCCLVPDYAAYVLHSYDVMKVFYGFGGGCRQSMSFEDLKRLPIPLPPHTEQQRIAEYLDSATSKIDRLTELRHRQKELLLEQRAALIQQVVTSGMDSTVSLKDSGLPWLGQIPAHWPVLPLKRVCNTSYGLTVQLDRKETQGTHIISLPNVTKYGDLDLEDVPRTPLSDADKKALLLRRGDLLFNWRNGSVDHVGKTALFDAEGEYTHVSFLLRLRFNLAIHDSRYFHLLLNHYRSLGFFSTAKVQVNNTFNMDELRRLLVAVPPKDEQTAIVGRLASERSRFSHLLQHYDQQLGLLAEYRNALIYESVTGQRAMG